MKGFSFLLIAILFLIPQSSQAKSQPKKNKKACQEVQNKIEQVQENLGALKAERSEIDKKIIEAKKIFEDQKLGLENLKGCSKGNPQNSTECENLLSSIRETSQQITDLQNQKIPSAKKKFNLENQLLTHQSQHTNLQCP